MSIPIADKNAHIASNLVWRESVPPPEGKHRIEENTGSRKTQDRIPITNSGALC